MKPFNLEQALAGKPVTTRDGRVVTQITKNDYVLSAVVDKNEDESQVHTFTIEGYLVSSKEPSSKDLCMSGENVTKYMIFDNLGRYAMTNGLFQDSKSAVTTMKELGYVPQDYQVVAVEVEV